VLIQTVTKGSTAAAAKLQPGDLLLGLTARLPDAPKDSVPEASDNLRDFDDLVERLKKFRPGDIVYLTVIRDFRLAALQGRLPRAIKPSGGEEVVEVKLKGWQELETDGR
jgi:S1-C subfamily serine protease